MVRVDVKILTKGGYDSKYLFPGAVTHTIGAITPSDANNNASYNQSVPIGGTTHHFRFGIVGLVNQRAMEHDLEGRFISWDVTDLAKPNTPVGSIHLFNDEGQYTYVDQYWFSRITPDNLVEALLADDREAKLVFVGNRGDDTLRGSYWHDEFDGGKGADRMIGGFGNDTYRVNSINDDVIEKADQGSDSIYTKIGLTLPKNVESLTGTGNKGLALTGNGIGNTISGTSGADTIKGLGGNDLMAGSAGKDVLYGGKGRDFFMFVTPPDGDVIKDFKHSADTIIVSQYAHWGLTMPDALYYYYRPVQGHPVASYSQLDPRAFHSSKSGKAHDVDDRILYDTTDGRLFFDPDGNGSAPRQLIATLSEHPKLDASDFLIL